MKKVISLVVAIFIANNLLYANQSGSLRSAVEQVISHKFHTMPTWDNSTKTYFLKNVLVDSATIVKWIKPKEPYDSNFKVRWLKGRVSLQAKISADKVIWDVKLEPYGLPMEYLMRPPGWYTRESNGILEKELNDDLNRVLKGEPPSTPPATPLSNIKGNSSITAFGTDANVTFDDYSDQPQNETSVAIYNNYAYVAFNDYRQGYTGYSYSTDAGVTWASNITNFGSGHGFAESTDPVLDVDGFGNVYMCTLPFDRNTGDADVYVYKSTDHGVTFNSGVLASPGTPHEDDKQWMITQTVGNQTYVYVTMTAFYPVGWQYQADILFFKSTDGGNTFGPNGGIKLNDDTYTSQRNGSQIRIAPDGTLYVVWGYDERGTNAIYCVKSTDGGNTWSQNYFVTNVPFNSGDMPWRNSPMPGFAISPTTGTLFVVYSKRINSSDYDVYIRTSTDGINWSAESRVNRVTTGYQFFPFVTVDNSGTVWVAWLDTRAGGNKIDCYVNYSTDDGTTWQSSDLRVSDNAYTPGWTQFIGDYIGIDAHGGFVGTAWPQTRGGDTYDDVYYDHMSTVMHDVGITQITQPQGTYYVSTTYTQTITPKVVVKNFGSNTESFNVHFNINMYDGSLFYSDVQTVNNLAPGDTTTVTFTSFVMNHANHADYYYDTTWTDLATDQNSSNDTLFNTFKLYRQGLQYLIVDVDPNQSSASYVDQQLQFWGYAGVYQSTFPSYSTMSAFQSIWIFLGVLPNNYQLNSTEANDLVTYLQNGGYVYMEGGDCWAADPNKSIYDPYFGIDDINSQNGNGHLTVLTGVQNGRIGWVVGKHWLYSGENNSIDSLVLLTGNPGGGLTINPRVYLIDTSVSYNAGVLNRGDYNGTQFRTIAHSFEISGLNQVLDATPDTLVFKLMRKQFLIPPTQVEEMEPNLIPYVNGIKVLPSLLSHGQGTILLTSPVPGYVTINLYNSSGRRIRQILHTNLSKGVTYIPLNMHDLTPGVYFINVRYPDNNTRTKRIVVVKQ